MSRAIDLTLEPKAHAAHSLRLNVHTYGYDVKYATMRETVYLEAECGPLRLASHLTADEARVLANQLLQVADQADENKARREDLEDIEEQLRDPDYDSSLVRYCHPDIVYAAPGDMDVVAAKNPGKIVISVGDQGGIGLAARDSQLEQAASAGGLPAGAEDHAPLNLSISSPRVCEAVQAALSGTGPEVILHGAHVEMRPA